MSDKTPEERTEDEVLIGDVAERAIRSIQAMPKWMQHLRRNVRVTRQNRTEIAKSKPEEKDEVLIGDVAERAVRSMQEMPKWMQHLRRNVRVTCLSDSERAQRDKKI